VAAIESTAQAVPIGERERELRVIIDMPATAAAACRAAWLTCMRGVRGLLGHRDILADCSHRRADFT
jgi:hypothetical protein